jgi:hypothetical protein
MMILDLLATKDPELMVIPPVVDRRAELATVMVLPAIVKPAPKLIRDINTSAVKRLQRADFI